MNDAQALAKAHRAERELIETEEAYDRLRAKLVEKLVSTSIDQQALREKLYFAIQAADSVRKALMDVVQNGQIAEIALAQQNLLRP
jgi:hypothetical protein